MYFGMIKPLPTRNLINISAAALILLGGFFAFPSFTSAELSLPVTPCDDEQVDAILPTYNVSAHLVPGMIKEPGNVAFQYGADNNSFVSKSGDIITFNVNLLFTPDNPLAIIKLMAFDASCNIIFGFGPAFLELSPNREKVVTFDTSTNFVSHDGNAHQQFPNFAPRYVWVEVVDQYPNANLKTYSYLIDILDPQNPTGQPDIEPPQPPARNPVIIIPGITGTQLFNGDDEIWLDLGQMAGISDQFITENLSLDEEGNSVKNIRIGDVIEVVFSNFPFFEVNTFENLRLKLELEGYQKNVDLFYFPYDWRLDLENTKDLLNQEIENIKVQTGAQKVDIVAHSMGGLLAKNYLYAYGKVDIEKLIFVGTPHLGAPKAGKTILQGDNLNIPTLNDDRVRELALNFPAIHELLPSEKFFSEAHPYILPHQTYQDTTDFFLDVKGKNPIMFTKAENFFSKNLQDFDFSGMEVSNIIGCKRGTQASYMLGKFGRITRVGYSSGDGTVPMSSASYAPGAHNYYLKNGSHAGLSSTTEVRNLISDLLTNDTLSLPNALSESPNFCSLNGKQLIWRSPVEAHIYDEQGNHTGPIENNNIEYNVPGVDYDVIGEEKFVFLPSDEGQIYNVHGIGLEEGTFDLQISEVNDGVINSTKVFNDVTIGTGSQIDFSISDTSSDTEILVDNLLVPASAELFGEQALDLTAPETTAVATGNSGNDGWYMGDVNVTLNAQDDGSGILETRYSLDNGQSFAVYIAPILITEEGIKNILYYSVDKAGNNEAVKSLEIKIDKSPPEIAYQFDLLLKDFIFDTIEEPATLTCSLKNCVAIDQAGNQTRIDFEKQRVLNLRGLSLKSITQKGQTKKFSENLLLVKLIVKKNQIADFNQTIIISKQELGRIDYIRKTNTSRILEFTKGSGFNHYTLPGIHFLNIVTSNNYLNINIE